MQCTQVRAALVRGISVIRNSTGDSYSRPAPRLPRRYMRLTSVAAKGGRKCCLFSIRTSKQYNARGQLHKVHPPRERHAHAQAAKLRTPPPPPPPSSRLRIGGPEARLSGPESGAARPSGLQTKGGAPPPRPRRRPASKKPTELFAAAECADPRGRGALEIRNEFRVSERAPYPHDAEFRIPDTPSVRTREAARLPPPPPGPLRGTPMLAARRPAPARSSGRGGVARFPKADSDAVASCVMKDAELERPWSCLFGPSNSVAPRAPHLQHARADGDAWRPWRGSC